MSLFGSFIITQLELQDLPLPLPDKEVCIRLAQDEVKQKNIMFLTGKGDRCVT